MISFKISIFALADTAFILREDYNLVVISFKISIFALADTASVPSEIKKLELWLALKLVSLH